MNHAAVGEMAQNSKWRLLLAAGLAACSLLVIMPGLFHWLRHLPIPTLTYVWIVNVLWFTPLGIAISIAMAALAGIAALALVKSSLDPAMPIAVLPGSTRASKMPACRELLASGLLFLTIIGLIPVARESLIPVKLPAIAPFTGPAGLMFGLAILLSAETLLFGRRFGNWTRRLGWLTAFLGCFLLGSMFGEFSYFSIRMLDSSFQQSIQQSIHMYASMYRYPFFGIAYLQVPFCLAAIWSGLRLASLPEGAEATPSPRQSIMRAVHLIGSAGLFVVVSIYIPLRIGSLIWNAPIIATILCALLTIVAVWALIEFRNAILFLRPRRFERVPPRIDWPHSLLPKDANIEADGVWSIKVHTAFGDKFLLLCTLLLPSVLYWIGFQFPVELMMSLRQW